MKEQGFDDVEDFMHSFDDAKEAAAMVKCPLCELLVADLIAVYAAKNDADGVESMIENLCSTPAQQTRLQAMYQMEKSDGGVEIARWEHDSTEALEQRLQAAADGGDDWQGDVHTVLCNSEWVPNAPDLAEAIAEGAPIDFSEETLRTDTALAPQLAKDVCALRVCKAKKKKKKNGKKPKPFNRALSKAEKRSAEKRAAEEKKLAEAAAAVEANKINKGKTNRVLEDMQKKMDSVNSARESGVPPDPTSMWEAELDEKLAAAKARSKQRREKADFKGKMDAARARTIEGERTIEGTREL